MMDPDKIKTRGPAPTLEEVAQRIEAQKVRDELEEIVFKHTTRASKWWEFVPAIGDKR